MSQKSIIGYYVSTSKKFMFFSPYNMVCIFHASVNILFVFFRSTYHKISNALDKEKREEKTCKITILSDFVI